MWKVCLAVGILSGLHATAIANEIPPADLTLEWAYQVGDSPFDAEGRPLWARAESEGWKLLAPLATPQDVQSNAILWLRLPTPQGAWPDPALHLGSVSAAFEVYVDGQRVYRSGQVAEQGRNETASTGSHVVPLPPDTAGKVVYLRMQSNTGIPSIQRDARIGNRATLLEMDVRRAIPGLAISAVLLMMAIVALISFLRMRQQSALLLWACFTLCTAVTSVTLGNAARYIVDAPLQWYRLLMIATYLQTPLLCGFVTATFVSEGRHWLRRLTQVTLVIGVLMALVSVVNLKLAQQAVMPFLPVVIFGQLACLWVTARQAVRDNRDAAIFVVGLLCLVTSAIFDSAAAFSSGNATYLTPWGMLLMGLALASIMIARFVKLHESMQVHATQLEERHAVVKLLSDRLVVGAQELSGVVAQLRSSSEEQERSITGQSTTLREALTTAEEIQQTSQLAARKAAMLMEQAADAETIGQTGESAVEKSLSGLEAIQGEVTAMARRIQALDVRTREIGTIVDTVKGLADQSNMLALNAAIEAVRSGEHGKGFAVVAREVRSLADQSIQATARIREILARLSEEIRETTVVSERGEDRVRASMQQVQSSGEQLRRLAEIVATSTAGIRQISAAVGQQNAGVNQTFLALNDLSAQMQETLTRLDETRAATTSVQEVARELARLSNQAEKRPGESQPPLPAAA
jgi:methyl-accepting chemotaxis protein